MRTPWRTFIAILADLLSGIPGERPGLREHGLAILPRSSLPHLSPNMTATPKPTLAKGSDSDTRLTIFVAHALSQPLRLAGETEASLSSHAVFWTVAACEGRTQIEVAHDTGLSAKTVSRVVSHLGDSRDGLGWIRQVADDGDRRVRRLFLSRKGKSVLGRLLKDLKSCEALANKS